MHFLRKTNSQVDIINMVMPHASSFVGWVILKVKLIRSQLRLLLTAVIWSCAAIYMPSAVAQDLGAKPNMGFSVWDREFDSDCVYRMTFLGEEDMLLESGGQVAIKDYRIRRYGRTGFYTLSLKTTSHNKQVNCDGEQGFGVGQKHGTYIKFNEAADTMTFYSEPNNSGRPTVVFKRR